MKNLLPYLYMAIVLILPLKCLAQENYSVVHFNSDNGLPQNSIKSIAADSYGFIWLATEDGLVRFDGREFYVYNKSNLNISDNRALFIHRTKRASCQSGLARNQTCVVHFQDDTAAIKIEKGIAVRDILYDRSRKKNMQFLYNEPGQLVEAKDFPDNMDILSFPFQRYLVSAGDNDENFYICDNAKIKYYKRWKMQYQVLFSSNNQWNFFSLKEALYYFDKKGSTISKIFNGRIQRMPMLGEIKADPAYAGNKENIRLYWNHNSDQAFLALGKNLYILERGENNSIITKLLVGNFDLKSRGVTHIYYDIISKKVFLGSKTQGLYILTPNQFRALNSSYFPDNVFYGQLPYSDNTIVSPRGGVMGIDPLTNKVYESKVNAFAKTPDGDDRLIVRDIFGNIWVRGFKKLIQKDSLATKVLRVVSFQSEIRGICQQKGKWLWFGVLYDGLYRIDTSNPFSTPEVFLKDSLLKVTCLQFHSDNELLIGTTKGLYTINIASKNLKIIAGTRDMHIKSIHAADQNQFWITALEKGLMLFTNMHKVIVFPLDKNRYLASAHCVIDDGNGYLWITTNRGLFQMKVKDLLQYAQFKIKNSDKIITARHINIASSHAVPELFYAYHTRDEGFNTNEFNGSCMPCAVKLANGNISLPSIDGLVWFKPGLINNAYFPNDSILVDRFEVNRKAINTTGDTLHFPLDPKSIRIHFTTAYFGNNYNLNISYALLKEHEKTDLIDWTPVKNEDLSIRYSNIESGHYVLLIRKIDGFGVNNVQVKKIYLDVPPFWYETAWARISIGLVFFSLLAMIMYLYNRHRLRSIEIENTRLEGLVFDRTAELMDTLKQLEQSKTDMSGQIYTMSRVLTSITHDIQSPLKYIAYSSGNVPGIIKNGRFEDAAEITTSISDISSRMSVLLGDLLDYIRVQVYGKGVQSQEVQIRSLIEDKLALFNVLILKNGSLVNNQVPKNLRISTDYLLLSIIIHNLLDNASKCTHNGVIDVSCQVITEGKTELIITNSGNGISKQMVAILNSSKKETDTEIKIRDQRASGLGLLIVKEVANLLDISIQVTQTGQTNFHLIFDNKPEQPGALKIA
jgi:signal transduction histidine kinase